MLSHVSTSDDDIISTAESAAIAAIMEYENVARTSLYLPTGILDHVSHRLRSREPGVDR